MEEQVIMADRVDGAVRSPEGGKPYQIERRIPAYAGSLRDMLDEIIEALRFRRFPLGDLDEIRLALQEALANAFRHGSDKDSDKTITVRAECDAETGLCLIVRDEGPGFEPDQVPDPTMEENLTRGSGRGLYLMRQLMDEVEFTDGGREVRLRRLPR